tara:strand:- start:1 stop:543 length:543 start_codon:yes stop_codon:yes gene_type:complete
MIAPINFPTTGMQERNRVAGQFIDEPFFNISAAKNIFGSTDRLDEKQKYLDYLKNDEKLRERGILPPRKMVFGGFDPNNFESAFSIAQTPRGDSTPIYFDDHMKQYVPGGPKPQQFPEYMKAGGPSSGDFRLAGLVGFEDWTGPAEHGPIPDIFKTKSINQKGLKSLMEEMREYRRRGVL